MLKPEQEGEIRRKLRYRAKELPTIMQEFVNRVEGEKSLSTAFEYQKDLKLFCHYLKQTKKGYSKRPFTSITPEDIDRINEQDIISFLYFLSEYKLSYKSAAGKPVVQHFSNKKEGKNRKLSTLKAFFSYCNKEGLIRTDVTSALDLAETPGTNLPNRLTRKQLDVFFQEIITPSNLESEHALMFHQKVCKRDLALCLILAYTGIKVSELCNLNVDDIDEDNHSIFVRRKQKGWQSFEFPEELFVYIENYYTERMQLDVGIKDDEHRDAFFLSSQYKRIDPKTIRLLLDKYRKRAGIETRVTPSSFRRTFGHSHFQKHKSLASTADALGNDTTASVERYYLREVINLNWD